MSFIHTLNKFTEGPVVPSPALGPRSLDRTKNVDVKDTCLEPERLGSILAPPPTSYGRDNDITLLRGLQSSSRELIFVEHLE